MKYLNLAMGLFLNPIVILIYVFFATNNLVSQIVSQKTSTNVSKFFPIYYLGFIALIGLLLWGALNIHNHYSSKPLSIFEIFESKWIVNSAVSYMISALVLYALFTSGVEWNVFGFIFFPLLIFSSIQFLVNIYALPFTFSMDKLTPLNLSTWEAITVALFNPLLIFMLVKDLTEKNSFNISEALFVTFFTIGLMTAFSYGCHWVIFKFKKTDLTMELFLGAKLTAVSLTPYLLSFIYLCYSFIGRALGANYNQIGSFSNLLMGLLIFWATLWQGYNYFLFWKNT